MSCSTANICTCCKCTSCPCKEAPLGAIIKGKPQITFNSDRTYPNGAKAPDGIEIRFGTTRPTAEVREMLKAHGFKFSEKQTLWYAKDTARARELASFLENNDVDIDNAQYEKRHAWTKVGSLEFYNKLTNFTEFMVKGSPPAFYRNKKQLEKSVGNISSVIYSDQLRFKKWWNKVVGEGGEEEGEEQAEEGSSEEGESEETEPTFENVVVADKLKSLADGMQKTIDSRINSATSQQRPTAKRLRVAQGMREQGYYLQNIQKVLYGLSEVHRNETIEEYPFLESIRTKSEAELLNKYTDIYGKWHEPHYLKSVFENNSETFRKLGIFNLDSWTAAIGQRDRLLSETGHGASQGETQEREKLLQLERKIWSMKIPGFFPTPVALVQRMISIADLSPRHSVLDPSAGKGDILTTVQHYFTGQQLSLSAIEISPTLREYLKLSGFNVIANDFMDYIDQQYDRILMNPPFEKGQDVEHVRHAFDLLKPDGRLVAIVSEGPFYRQSKKDEAFREFLAEKDAYVSEPIKGAFADAFNSTGVGVRLVAINKDGSHPDISGEEEEEEDMEDSETEDTEMLEAEAQAQLELLKLQLELKKKKGLQGLSGVELMEVKQRLMDIDLPAVWDFK